MFLSIINIISISCLTSVFFNSTFSFCFHFLARNNSGKVRIIDVNPPTTPSMNPKDETDENFMVGTVPNSFCVAVDGSGNSYAALTCVLRFFCNNKMNSVEVVHVPELNFGQEVAFDLQPAFVQKETMKEFERCEKSSSPESLVTSFVNAARTKSKCQSVRGTLAYHVNEISTSRFLVTGIVGAGGISDVPGTTMTHNLWCSRCTSIVIKPQHGAQDTKLLSPQHAVSPQKYVVAVDGSGRSHNAFQDVCDLCDRDFDSILIVHVLMNQLGLAAAAAIEQRYCKLLNALDMPGRVGYQCVEVDCGADDLPNDHIGEVIATFAKQERATFLAVGIDGAGIWHDQMEYAKQYPSPGRVVRFLSHSKNAPCSLVVNCTYNNLK